MANSELPQQFLASLRTLFDILDENKTGFVSLHDIETRWQVDGTEEGLPNGVLESLKKVTPQNGMLTFDRFVAGLKIALLRSRNDPSTGSRSVLQRDHKPHKPDILRHTITGKQNENLSRGTENLQNNTRSRQSQSAFGSSHSQMSQIGRNFGPTATVPPNNAIPNQHTGAKQFDRGSATPMLTMNNLRLTSTSSDSALTDSQDTWRKRRMYEERNQALSGWPNSKSALNKFGN